MREGIDIQHVVKDPDFPSGVALITVDSTGENSIVVAPGSNANLLIEDIPPEIFETGNFEILLLQLEIPINTVEDSAVRASEHGIKVILNPAPACKLSENLLKHVWLLTPNETEAEAITGKQITDIASVEIAAALIQERGVKNVIITLGETGAFVKAENYAGLIPGIKVSPVDTTAAGDVFNGALAVAVSEGKDLYDAVVFANKAASISVTRMGAQASAPYRNEIK
jgi:ribokinase